MRVRLKLKPKSNIFPYIMKVFKSQNIQRKGCCFMTNSLAHTKWVCKYHMVFTPKYRMKIISNQLRQDIQNIMFQVLWDISKGKVQ